MKPPSLTPKTASDVAETVRSNSKILAVGAGTKSGLSEPPAGFVPMSLRLVSGILEYDPSEFTFTALAGTPLQEIEAELAKRGQYLPFDPPFVERGATLGGAIAAGLSGPGRHRFGGLRDFILGVTFVTGSGEVVRGGGKVVKNAAGFDIPKLLVGSLGRLGIVVEATCKVFPRPRSTASLRVNPGSLEKTVDACGKLGRSSFDIEALDFESDGTLLIRLGGAPETFADRLKRLETFIGSSGTQLTGDSEKALWRGYSAWMSGPGKLFVKVPMALDHVPRHDRAFALAGAQVLYCAGGSFAWVRWPGSLEALDTHLRSSGLSGLVFDGKTGGSPLVGSPSGAAFRSRIKSALDPERHFPDF